MASLFLFRRRKGTQGHAYCILSVAMLWMFLCATAHFATNIRSLQDGFSMLNATDDSGARAVATYFNDSAQRLYIVDKSLDGVSTLIGNGLLIYRVYDMIPNGLWIVSFLVVLLVGAGVIEFYITNLLSQTSAPNPGVFAPLIHHSAPAVFTIPLALNIFITLIILLRIHQAERLASTRDGMHTLTLLRRMIITAFESAIILPCYLLVLVVLYFKGNDMLEVALIPITQGMLLHRQH